MVRVAHADPAATLQTIRDLRAIRTEADGHTIACTRNGKDALQYVVPRPTWKAMSWATLTCASSVDAPAQGQQHMAPQVVLRSVRPLEIQSEISVTADGVVCSVMCSMRACVCACNAYPSAACR